MDRSVKFLFVLCAIGFIFQFVAMFLAEKQVFQDGRTVLLYCSSLTKMRDFGTILSPLSFFTAIIYLWVFETATDTK